MAYWEYYDTINYKPNSYQSSYTFFCSFPSDYMSIGGAILSEISGTFFLVLAIWVATDNSRKIVTGTKIFAPAVIGIAGTGILACLGQQTGGAINPAIDLGSRLMSALIYESDEVWVFPSSNLHSAGEAYRIRRKMVKIRSVRVLFFF